MTVKRIVLDIATPQVAEVCGFCQTLFDLDPVMDMGWIATLASGHTAPVQISIASEGGAGAPVPDATIEVDNLDEVYDRAKTAGHRIVYDLTTEAWGVRRFFLRDPAGKILNVMAHV